MKVINRNAVNLLFEKAESLGQEPHESWRCIFFDFHDKPEKHNQSLYINFVVKPIIDILNDSAGYIYICDDGDIFVLFQGALKPVMLKLSEHFGDIKPDVKNQNGDLFKIYDLDKHWNNFYNICEAKYLDAIVTDEDERSNLHYYGRIPRVNARNLL